MNFQNIEKYLKAGNSKGGMKREKVTYAEQKGNVGGPVG